MIIRDDVLNLRDVSSEANSIAARLSETVRPPKKVRVEISGSQITLWCSDRGKFASRSGTSGADRYVAYWCEDVDISTQQGILNGAARATVAGDAGRVFTEDKEVPIVITRPQFQNGFFFVYGQNPMGDRSIDFSFTGAVGVGASSLDDSLPDNVDNFTASESGEVRNGTVESAISFQYFAPASKSFAGVQFFLANYPNIGEVTEFYVDRYAGPARGVSVGKFFAVPSRRPGIGTITATATSVNVSGTSSKFLSQFAPGDVVEILGVQGTVQSVTDDTHLVLTAGWTGKTVVGLGSWLAIGLITIYAVALSKAGTHGDYTKAPSVSILFDALLSAPLAPVLTGTAYGNANNLVVTPTPGTQIDHITLYKAKGSGIAFGDPTMSPIKTWPADVNNLSAPLQFVDDNFTFYDREQGQVYSYYATQTNVRGVEGAASARLELAARLDSENERPPGTGRHPAARNLIWNGMCWFNANATVDVTNANQDTKMNTGGAPPAGFYRIDHEENGGSTPAGFQNSTEIILPSPNSNGSDNVYAGVRGRVDAWQNANGHIPIAAYVCLQAKFRLTGGAISGQVRMVIDQFDGADAFIDSAYVSKRLSNDSIDETTKFFEFDPTTLLTTHRLFWAVFHLRSDIACDHIRWRILWQNSTTHASNINMTELMLSIGNDVPAWSADMATNIIYVPPSGGAPNPPHMPPDKFGGGTSYLRLETQP